MNIIKNIIIATVFATFSIHSYAKYEVIINVPTANMIKMVNIVPHTPFIGEWKDKGAPTNCSAWTPLPATVKKGQSFEQSSTCSQEQIRTIEEQLKNLDTGAISKTGKKTEETQTTSVIIKQSAVGTKAGVKQCGYGPTWGAGFWLEQPNNTVYFVWYGPSPEANEYVSKTLPNKPTTYTQDGYTYSRGSYNSYNAVSGYYYQICRE